MYSVMGQSPAYEGIQVQYPIRNKLGLKNLDLPVWGAHRIIDITAFISQSGISTQLQCLIIYVLRHYQIQWC